MVSLDTAMPGIETQWQCSPRDGPEKNEHRFKFWKDQQHRQEQKGYCQRYFLSKKRCFEIIFQKTACYEVGKETDSTISQ